MHASLTALAIGLVASTQTSFGGTGPQFIFVDASAPGLQTGASWLTAYSRLEDALADHPGPGVVFRVADGEYRPDGGTGNRAASFVVGPGVEILGGFAGFGAPDPDLRDPLNFETILTGDIGVLGQSGDNSFHVVRMIGGDGATLDGLFIKSGRADAVFPNDRGGGVSVLSGSPTLRNCGFDYNRATSGGAVDLGNGVGAQFIDCHFLVNRAYSNGGAVYAIGANPSFVGCSFVENTADLSGGAIFTFGGDPAFADCVLSENSSMIFGGAIYNSTGVFTIVGCDFDSNIMLNNLNVVYDGGGALYNDGGTVNVLDSTFNDNLSGDDGGALLAKGGMTLLERCLLQNNWSSDRGGGIYAVDGGLEIRSCAFDANVGLSAGGALFNMNQITSARRTTFFANESNGTGGGVHMAGGSLLLESCVLWSNVDSSGTIEASQVRLIAGTVTVNYSCMMGWTGFLSGISNIASGPQFVDGDGPDNIPGTPDDNLRLKPTSPCINLGDPGVNVTPELTDLDGRPRVMGCRLDMGAYEFPTGAANSGDMNGDGLLDGRDLSGFTAALLGTSPAALICVADLNNDMAVNEIDTEMMTQLLLGF